MAAVAPPPTLVGLHIGKTGGTTLHDHVRGAIDHPKAYFRASPFEDFRRAVSGRPLLPEMKPKAVQRIRFAAGHDLTTRHAFAFEEERLKLFTIIRDPFERFVSQYKQYLRARVDSGRPMGLREYLDYVPKDSAARRLHQSFGAFDSNAEATVESTKEILGNFDYVLFTERLDDQGSALMALIDLPPLRERRRAFPGAPDLEGLTRDDVVARDPIDNAIAEALRDAPPELGNPFAHDRSGRRRARAAYDASPDKIGDAYRAVLDYMEEHNLLRPSRIVGTATGNTALVERIEAHAAARGIDLSTPLVPEEESRTGALFLDLKDTDRARDYLLRATEHDPENFNAQFRLARALVGSDPKAALAACRRAVALNDTNEHARMLLDRLSRG